MTDLPLYVNLFSKPISVCWKRPFLEYGGSIKRWSSGPASLSPAEYEGAQWRTSTWLGADEATSDAAKEHY
jgi:hypothetical protein